MAQQQFDFNNIKPPNISGKSLRTIVVLGLIVIFGWSSWFTVSPEEVGVILRFGKYVRTVNPGLNFKIPFGVETVTKVAVERQEKEEFGFRTQRAGTRTQYSTTTVFLTVRLRCSSCGREFDIVLEVRAYTVREVR